MISPDKRQILEAQERIAPWAHRTPILVSSSIDSISQAKVYFKCENFQRVGAFKFRGACNAIASLTPEQKEHGVATHSSGNHGQALALAASLEGVTAFVVIPNNAPKVKSAAVAGYGARITFCEPTLQAREAGVERIVEEYGATLVHPYNDYRIICGQATAGKELIEDTEHLDSIVCPVGGGGLLSGTCLSAHYFSPGLKVYGAEPLGANDAQKSIREAKIIPSVDPETIADGLLTSLGDKTFPIIQNFVKDIITVDDNEIIYAMELIWQRLKIVVEPSGAVPLAVVLTNPEIFKGQNVGIILSGGNVDLGNLPFAR